MNIGEFERWVTSTDCKFSFAGMDWDHPEVLAAREAWEAAQSSAQQQRDELVNGLRAKVSELLEQRNREGMDIDKAILSGIVPDQHPMRSRLEMLANHRKCSQAMAELLGEIRPCLTDAWATDGHPARDEPYHSELLERIDALLAGKVPDHIADASKMVPEGWQLVPTEPTEDMLGHDFGASVMVVSEVAKAWDAMLEAAPTAKAKASQAGE